MNIELPIRIGDSENLVTYAATLVNGEEQLLITREGTLHISNGSGGLIDIETGLSESQVQALIQPISESITSLQSQLEATNNRLNEIETAVSNLGEIPTTE